MSELDSARGTRYAIKIICTCMATVAAANIWGGAAGWLVLGLVGLAVCMATGIEQEFRRIADVVRRAEERTAGK